MASYTDYAERKVNDKIWGATDFAPPATWYFGLSTTTIGDDGSNVTEPAGNGYARVAIANTPANFPSGSPKVLAAQVVFPAPTGTGWGTCTDWFIADAAVAGNVWVAGQLPSPSTIAAGAAPFWPVGAITLDQD